MIKKEYLKGNNWKKLIIKKYTMKGYTKREFINITKQNL